MPAASTTPAPASPPLRVLTLNLWHDQGPWRARAASVRRAIERLAPDVVGFQEVLRRPGVDLLADVLGDLPYHVAFAAAQPHWQRHELAFGNAVASRFPIAEQSELVLPHLEDPGHDDGERRVALAVSLATPHGALGVTCTHLQWKLHHEPQPYARAMHEPDRRIDYVLVGYPTPEGVGRVESCRVVCDEPEDGVWPSDHFGVLASLVTAPKRRSEWGPTIA